MPYVEFPITHVPLDDLALDLENYRIPTRREDEAAALQYLFAVEDAMGAARLILRDGYFDNEVPIVVVESSRFIVLEGNRRVSALKALWNPSLVPSFEAALRALLNRYAVEAADLPATIRVFVSPDRATAAPHIARLHTGLPKKRWSRDQQATFYFSLLNRTTTVDDVKAMYPDVEVPRFIRMAAMRRFLSAVHFRDKSIRAYAIADDLKMSVFEYAYRNKELAAAVGVQFNGDGFIEPSGRTSEQIGRSLQAGHVRALEYLLELFRKHELDTRSPEFQRNTEERDRLLTRLNDLASSSKTPSHEQASGRPVTDASRREPAEDQPTETKNGPDESRSGADPATRGAASSSSPEATGSTQTTRGPNHPQTKDRLDLSGISYDSAPVNLKLRYLELRKISLSELPISAAILLRSILEASIKVHFESTPTPVKGELSNVLKQVEDTYGKEKSLQSSIQHLRSGGGSKPGSIIWFNLVAHSADAAVTADDVREAWSRINPLIRRLLRPA